MTILSAWILTLALHGAVLLLVAWCIDRGATALRGATRELLWRSALFGCVLSATLQVLVPAQSEKVRRFLPAPLIATITDSTIADVAITDASKAAPPAHATPAAIADAPARTATRPAAPKSVAAGRSVSIAPPVGARDSEGVLPYTPLHWTAWLLGAWLAGVIIALSRIGVAWYRLHGALQAAAPVLDRQLNADLAALAARAGTYAPLVFVLDGMHSPIAAGGAIVLPAWAQKTLDRTQLQAMLAHELGHLERRDPQWKLLTATWRALLWFLPLAAIAQRRLDDLAELACDAFAARHTGDGRSLAECLASCAEHHVAARTFELAPAMAARPSALMNRIERLLEGESMIANGIDTDGAEAKHSGARARLVALAALGVAAACLPAIGFDSGRALAANETVQSTKTDAPHGHSSVSITSDDDGNDSMSISLSDDGHKFSAKVEGKIAFDDAETDITSLSNAGTATFDETRDGTRRRLDLREQGGKIERRYYVDGSERPIDDTARTWIATIVKQLARSGIGAEQRVRRIHARAGAAGVLDEIGQVPTDYVRGIYLRTLVGLGALTPAQLDRAIALAGAMGSDYERRQALTAVFETQALAPAQQVTFLRQALRFDGDYERAELLVGILPKLASTHEVRQAWLDAGLKINSDYERRRTLEAMLVRDGLDDEQLASVIEASSSMSSDYEHRELLVAAARRLHNADAIAPAYTRSAQKISSDYEHREALLALIQSGKLGSASATAVLDSAAHIGSSYECREVLVALARVMPADAAVVARYRQVAGKLPDYDRGEAERALQR